MEYQQQIHIGPGLESICRIPQKTNADTADTEKASATQNKSKWRCKFICPRPGKHPQPFYPTSADAFYCLKQIRIV